MKFVRTHSKLSFALGALTCLHTTGAIAQQTPLPDAGSLRQQIEGNRLPELPALVAPETRAGKAAGAGQTGPSVQVLRFRFAGNTLLDETELQALVAPYVGQSVEVRQLRETVGPLVANAYRKQGWVVSVVLQEPVPAGGEVSFRVIESRLGQVQLDAGQLTRVSKEQVQSMLLERQRLDEPLNNLLFDRALLLVNDLPGVSASSRQKPGQKAGTTDVVVQASDKPALAGDVSADNTGSRAMGDLRFNANLEWRGPAQRGDALSAGLVHTEGSEYVRVGYTVPAGADGWRVGANLTSLNYKLVAPELVALRAYGNSDSAGVDATYPLLRTRNRNLYFNTGLEHKYFDNRANGSVTSNYLIDNLTLGLSGNQLDNWGGAGSSSFSLTLVNGNVDLSGSPNQALDRAGANTQGNFSKLRLNLVRSQAINDTFSVLASYTGQFTEKNLDGSEKLYLGGANGVRAYPSSEAGGSTGSLVSLELRARLPENMEASFFHDWGQVVVNPRNGFAGASANNELALRGYGLSLSWRQASGASIKATWARRAGSNPNPTATGNDQDGSLTLDRLWLTATYTF